MTDYQVALAFRPLGAFSLVAGTILAGIAFATIVLTVAKPGF